MNILSNGLLENYKEDLIAKEKSITTIDKYVRDVKGFISYVKRRYGKSAVIDKEVVLSYKDYLGKKYKYTSANSMLAAANMFFRTNGWYDCVVKPYKIQKEAFRRNEKDLSVTEYKLLVQTAYAKGDERLGLAMETICCTGIRVGELKYITVQAIDCGVAEIWNKGKTRTILIIPLLCEKLKEYAEKNGIKSGSIFITCSGQPIDRSNLLRRMKALCADADINKSKVYPHNLRHLFANTYYNQEKDLAHLADILGHSNINTTRIYTACSSSEQIKIIQEMGLLC